MTPYELRKLKSKRVQPDPESFRSAEDVIAMTIDNLVSRGVNQIHAFRNGKYNDFLAAYAHRNNIEVIYLTAEQQQDYEK